MVTALMNPQGAVCLFDGEVPRTFTGKALLTISGGDFVYCSGAPAAGAEVVCSGASSFVTSDLQIDLCGTWGQVNGIALGNAGSDELVTIATRGNYLLKSAGAVSGGTMVTLLSGANTAAGFDGVVSVASDESAGSTLPGVIGRALTSAGSDYFCLVSLNL